MIDDHRITSSIKVILPGLDGFIVHSNTLIHWQEEHIDSKIQIQQSNSDLELPFWINNQDYQGLLKLASDSLSDYLAGLEHSVNKIKELALDVDDPPYLNIFDKTMSNITFLHSAIQFGLTESIRKFGNQNSRGT